MYILDMFKVVGMSQEQKSILNFFLTQYVKYDPANASWLYSLMDNIDGEYKLDLSNIDYKWVGDENSQVQGMFNPLYPNTIFVFPMVKYTVTSLDQALNRYLNLSSQGFIIAYRFPAIVHQLYHMLQFKTSKIGYFAMRLLSVFTTIPYYLFQNAKWMPAYRKLTQWDLEGQAQKYGDKAPKIEEFSLGVINAAASIQIQSKFQLGSLKEDRLRMYGQQIQDTAQRYVKLLKQLASKDME